MVLVMLCIIGTASANEPLDKNLTATDTEGEIGEIINDEQSVSDSQDKLSAEGDTITVDAGGSGDYQTISAAVGAATGGETIFIKNGEYTESSTINIGKSLNFVGESNDGVSLKLSQSGKISLIESNTKGITISFKNLIFKDSENTGGSGLIRFYGSSAQIDVNFTDCTFSNLTNKYGIQIATLGTINLEGCKFNDLISKSSNGATGIYTSVASTINIKNTIFENLQYVSTGGQNGAVIFMNNAGSTLNMENVTIQNFSGVANSIVRSTGTVDIKKSKFINNNVQLSSAGYVGDSLFYIGSSGKMTMEQSIIANNTVAKNVIYMGSSASTTMNYNNIYNNTFDSTYEGGFKTNNGALDADYNYWGSNDQPSTPTVNNWVIEENGEFKLNDGSELDKEIPVLDYGGDEPVITDAIYVATDGSDDNDGSEASPVANITKAIELAKAGSGNIIIKEGTYAQNGITIDGDKAITIIGQGNVVIDGTDLEKASVFTVTATDVTIKNIKFENGNARYGGALNIQGSSVSNLLDVNVIVENCSFNNSKATRGGAIYAYCTKGNLIVKNSNFTNMDVTWGAICAYQSAFDGGLNVDITNSIFANNKANNGAALYMQASQVSVADCDIYNNIASQSPGAIYLTNVTATFDNCKIYNNSALKDASAIAVYAGKISSNPTVLKASEVTITNCIIENNTATEDGAAAIYLENSKLDISYSSIVNTLNIHNTVTANYDDDQPETVTANNNWWGTDDPSSTVKGKNIVIDNWVIMNVVANATEVLVGDEVKLTIDFNHVNTTSGEVQELTGGAIPKTFTVTLTSTSGELEPAAVEISKGTSKDVIYTVADVDAVVSAQTGDVVKTLSFSKGVEPYYGIIYVDKNGKDNNNGSEMFPVLSIAKAVELALVSGGSGQIVINEGTYNGTDYHVTGDLTVTGNGNVILDGEENGRLFYMAYGDSVDKLHIANLTIINVKHGYGAAVYSMAKELILENVNISSAPGAGSLISNTGKMTIQDCEIANHNGGNVIATSGNYDLIINNTVFKNNTVISSSSDYGIVYISSGKGNLYIEKSQFINSTTRHGVIISPNSDKNIYVKSSEFINNKMQNTYASGGAISANNKLEVSDSIFINNTACGDGGAINLGRWGDATITQSLFVNNAAGNNRKGDAINSGNKLTLNYNVILSNGNNKVLYHSEEYDADAKFNWWGTNNDPSSLIGVGTYEDDWGDDVDCVVDSSNWVVMTVTSNLTDEIEIDDTVEFNVDFTHTNTGAALAETIPEVEVSATAVNGDVAPEKQTTENNVTKFIYSALEGGEDTFTVTSSNAVNTTAINVKVPVIIEVIYVSETGSDDNNGTRSSPVATLEHAIEIAQRGKIVILPGQYTIAQTIKLEKDMDIKGEGTVIIDANKTKVFNNYANLNLTNIKIINASSAVGSIVDNQADTSLMIIDCEFYSNVATGSTGGIIHMRKGNLNLTESKFHENTIKRGVVSAAADTSVIIKDCEFFNHVTTQQYGLIKIDGSDAVIENSIFRNNSIGNGAGIYITSSKNGKTIKINNDTFIDNKATQSSMGNGGAIYVSIASGSVDLTITNSKFINNTAAVNGGAIYLAGNNAKAIVDGCLFINNSANDGNSIYIDNGQQFTVSNSVILNYNGIAMNKKSTAHTSKINAENNYWGDNAKANVNPSISVSSWIIMNASYTVSEEGVLTITAEFDKTNSTSGEVADYAGKLPDGFDVTFTSTSGLLNEVVIVKDGQASVDYTRDAYLDSDITVKVLNDEIVFPFAVKPSVIYVSPEGDDNNDGDKDTPVASLQKAIELAEKGQIVILEGTYKTGDLGIISDDLTITGEGKVTIDAENNNRVLYVGEDTKVTLKNLILINGFAAEESGALLGNSNELILINCTLANSSAGENNGGAIYNVGKLIIINSTIANNTARIGGAIFTNGQLAKGPTIKIENSIIENNTATGNDNAGGGAIFAQQLTGLTISNTTFENNQALTTASGGAIFISHSNANMQITDSRFIANHANGQEQTDGGAIYFAGESLTPYTTGTLTISNTLFENNTADANGGAIYSRSTKVNVKNSVLINNTDENGISVYGHQTEQVAPSITANENWWGTNADPSAFVGGNAKYKPTVNNWAILTITNDTEIKDGNTVKLTVAIDSYTDGETVTKMENPITVPIPVTIKTNKGDIEGVLTNGEFTYDLDATRIKYISANVDGVEEVLYADTVATSIIIDDITAQKGDIVEYVIKVNAADGTTINKGYVVLFIDGDVVNVIEISNGIAKDNIAISKDVGTYNISVKYLDETQQYAENETNKTLTVTGVNNIVTPETFYNFFDENGNLREEIPLDELFFKGEFNDLGIISIGKSIKITGDGATFKNTAISIDADDVCVSNISFVADKQFDENDGGLIYIGGDNVTLTKNNITYNAPDNVESHAITVDVADGVKITDNNIVYTAKSEGSVETIAVKAISSDNLVFENNKLDATILSVSICYTHFPDNDYYSQGVHIEDSNNLTFNNNDIDVKYNVFAGMDDTIYAVHVLGCDDSRITDNSIDLNGHMNSYGLVTNNNQNLTVSGNDINVVSDDHYACGLQVGGDSSADVKNNNISAKAVDVTYPVYLDDWENENCEVNLTDNNIKGESDSVYGVYVEENKTSISNNTIDVNGNHVYGIVSHQTDMVIDSNDINATGKDIGPIVSPQSGVNENTTGIIVSESSAKITNNNVVTTGKSAIAAINTNATISNNGLTANGTTADNAIKNINSNVTTSNNTEAKTKDKNTTPDVPVSPVVKITAKNNANVDYGFTYQVRVTEDSKSVGAGKYVTLKIAGKTLKAKTDKNGYAKFTLAVKPKVYNVVVTYNKVSQKYKITVKNVIKAKKLKVKKSAKKLKVKVTLKTSAKKPIKGKKVILKIKGKKIKAKTNKKGVATFKIKKNVLKKLKAGKKYKYQVIYGKDKVKKTLKVKK